MAWQLNGTILIACNCDWGCPCNFNALPSKGKCEGGWIWSVAEGNIDGVAVDGLALALFSDWPGAIHDGGGRAVCFVDERSDDRQREALTRLIQGRIGGPWGIFINTYELSGPAPARFALELNEYDTRVSIGDAVKLEFRKIRNPVTGAEVHPEIVLPEGLVTKHSKLAVSKRFHVNDGISFDHSGQYAAFGPFSYAGA